MNINSVLNCSSSAFVLWVSGLQEVNENSLKRLNGYLEGLQRPGFRTVKPTKLTFYLREVEEKTESNDDVLHSGKFFFFFFKTLSH